MSDLSPASHERQIDLTDPSQLYGWEGGKPVRLGTTSGALNVSVNDPSGTPVNPVTENSATLLRRILNLLKPLGIVTGNGSNRLSVDVGTASTVSTVTTVATVSTLTNQANVGNVNAFDQAKNLARNAYSNGIRAHIV